VRGISANEVRIAELMQRSLMLVTALTRISATTRRPNRQARAPGRQHPEGSRARAGLRERRRFRALGQARRYDAARL